MISDSEQQQLHRLVEVFLAENSQINLSALRDEESCWIGNVLDSLGALELAGEYDLRQRQTLLDIGTGGGFPLLPLAICLPQLQLTGLDSTQKKIDAIGRIAAAMELKNIRLISERCEVLGRDAAYREQFDIVTARAVAPLNTLLEYMAPFTKQNGFCICWKSLQIEEELQASLNARSELACRLVHTHQYELPGDWGRRQLLVFQKTNPLPKRYPRETGLPKKLPL